MLRLLSVFAVACGRVPVPTVPGRRFGKLFATKRNKKAKHNQPHRKGHRKSISPCAGKSKKTGHKVSHSTDCHTMALVALQRWPRHIYSAMALFCHISRNIAWRRKLGALTCVDANVVAGPDRCAGVPLGRQKLYARWGQRANFQREGNRILPQPLEQCFLWRFFRCSPADIPAAQVKSTGHRQNGG